MLSEFLNHGISSHINNIVGHHRIAVVRPAQYQFHIIKTDTIHMADIKTPCRQFAEHMELRIACDFFRYVLNPVFTYVRHTLGATTRMRYCYILQPHVLDSMPGDTGYAVWKRIVDNVDIRSTEVIVFVGTPKRNLAVKIADIHITQTPRRISAPVTQTHENGVSGITGIDAVNADIIHFCAVDCLDGNSGTECIANADVADVYVPDISESLGTNF